jgi:hypothetical protein
MTRRNIVEGEPGIFPQPIADALRWLAGPFRRRADRREAEQQAPPDEPAPPSPEA